MIQQQQQQQQPQQQDLSAQVGIPNNTQPLPLRFDLDDPEGMM
jgi:hypothetical protein